ncbi:MAG: hypothetical protein GC155_01855 [Alphaproteobacteria bacterium]|nr:hypothetical protein [Alphaproteobacteria bacterium]
MSFNRMSVTALALALAAMTAAPAALAHTHVHEMSIADNAKLAASPPDFTFELSEAAGLAKVTLADAAGKAIPLAYTPPKDMAASFKIPLPKLDAGAYVLSFRTIADDGHAMTTAVHFTVTG